MFTMQVFLHRQSDVMDSTHELDLMKFEEVASFAIKVFKPGECVIKMIPVCVCGLTMRIFDGCF